MGFDVSDHDHAAHCGHDHHDESDAILSRAMGGFFILGLIQVVAAIASQRLALIVDGVHNMSETGILGINRSARRMDGRQKSTMWTCWLLPLAPAVSSILAVSVAAVMPFILTGYHTTTGVWLAFGLSLVSLGVNLIFASRLHAGHSHGDSNSLAAMLHLIGDSMASLLAAAAYLVIGLTSGHTWLDLGAEIGGAAIIAMVHIQPTTRSVRDFCRHRRPGHEGCINSPVSSH